MKNRIFLLTALLAIVQFSFGQKKENFLRLRSGTVILPSNISPASLDSINGTIARFDKVFFIIQFDEIPTALTKQQLSSQGIELLNYIPDKAYTVSIKSGFNAQALLFSKARAIYKPLPQQKMDPSLANGTPPPSSVAIPGMVDVWINFPKTYTSSEVISLLQKM